LKLVFKLIFPHLIKVEQNPLFRKVEQKPLLRKVEQKPLLIKVEQKPLLIKAEQKSIEYMAKSNKCFQNHSSEVISYNYVYNHIIMRPTHNQSQIST
jgi:hypothetical protein